jgi:capsular exopolysaccharide synthesis family protein
MAFLVSLCGGLALAVVRYQGKDSLLTLEDVERRTGMTVIAAIPALPPDVPDALRPLYPMDHPHSLPAEAYRSLRTMLQVRSGSNQRVTLLVTSGVPGEGKTTVSVGIASSFARLGRRTLLIDADVRRPRVHEVFGGSADNGLCNVLREHVNPLHLIRETPQDNLYYLSAGVDTEQGAELLFSTTFQQMLAHVHKSFDFVILDTSPVGLIGDALAFSKDVDGAVVVVRRDLAPARMALDTKAQLEGAGARVFGAIFNGVPPSRDAKVYGKGYYTENPAKQRTRNS